MGSTLANRKSCHSQSVRLGCTSNDTALVAPSAQKGQNLSRSSIYISRLYDPQETNLLEYLLIGDRDGHGVPVRAAVRENAAGTVDEQFRGQGT